MSTDPRFAEPTPFARLVYAHAVSMAGDACLTVSLAGSLFFQSPTSAAREKVLLYLLLTMAPFAIVAPILGPAIDRTNGGRRLLVVASSAGRAVLCIFMAMYVSKPAPEGLLVYPLAFGALVLAKGHQVAKSSLVPALVKSDAELVNANSRLALVSVIAATVGGLPAAGIQALFGADWSLRVAAIVFAIGAVLALQIPRTRTAGPSDPHLAELEQEEIHQPSILLAGSAMAVLRGSVGFLAFFVAFALKDDLFGLGAALVASAIGGFIGV
ncbi:MAG: MFS transporter, partial [Acidimicrobiia bacterium]